MKIFINDTDNNISIDELSFNIPFSLGDEDLYVIRFDTELKTGSLEFYSKAPQNIKSFEPYNFLIDLHKKEIVRQAKELRQLEKQEEIEIEKVKNE
jgi:hypothetical protein